MQTTPIFSTKKQNKHFFKISLQLLSSYSPVTLHLVSIFSVFTIFGEKVQINFILKSLMSYFTRFKSYILIQILRVEKKFKMMENLFNEMEKKFKMVENLFKIHLLKLLF